MLITICKMLSHHFLIHSLLGIPTSAPCHYCGLVTAREANGISNEEISGLWESIHVQVVSKHHLNEPNFALDPKYHLYTYEGQHTHTYTEADILRTPCEKYPNASWLHFFCFAFSVFCFFLKQLGMISWDRKPKLSIKHSKFSTERQACRRHRDPKKITEKENMGPHGVCDLVRRAQGPQNKEQKSGRSRKAGRFNHIPNIPGLLRTERTGSIRWDLGE